MHVNSLPYPQLARPDRPPEMVVGSETVYFGAKYWAPQHDSDIGKIEVVCRPGQPRDPEWPQFEMEGLDVPKMMHFISKRGYQRIFEYCGLSCHIQGTYPEPSLFETTVPHPQLFVGKLGELCAQAACTPTPFTLLKGRRFTDRESVTSLADKKGVLLATEPNSFEMAHDVLIHGAVLGLMPPEYMSLASQRASLALASNDLKDFMNGWDGLLSVPGIGEPLMRALRYEGTTAAPKIWEEVETQALCGLGITLRPPFPLGELIRGRCRSLYQAAVTLRPPAPRSPSDCLQAA